MWRAFDEWRQRMISPCAKYNTAGAPEVPKYKLDEKLDGHVGLMSYDQCT
jgi:hypothetical protein